MSALQILSAGSARSEGSHSALTGGDQLSVRDLGEGCDHDACPGDLGAPGKVQVLPQDRNDRVETAKGCEKVRANERHAARRDEDISLQVLLAVVYLTEFDAFVHDAESVTGLANVQQDHRIVVVHELWCDDAGVGAKGRFNHQLNGVWFETNIIVAEEEEGRAIDHQGRFIARSREPAILVEDSDVRARRHGGDSRRDVLALPVRHDEQA